MDTARTDHSGVHREMYLVMTTFIRKPLSKPEHLPLIRGENPNMQQKSFTKLTTSDISDPMGEVRAQREANSRGVKAGKKVFPPLTGR